MGRTHRAFSLVEILVAVAIVGLIAVLAFPALRSAQERARRLEALQHLRQIGVACSLYAGENNGSFPGSSHNGNSWMAGLLPYFQLETTATSDQLKEAYRSPGDPDANRISSYAINDLLLPKPAGAPQLNYSRSVSLPAPVQTLLFAETVEKYGGGDHFHFAYGYQADVFRRSVAVDRYQDGGLYLFADYRAEWLGWTDAQQRLTQTGDAFVHPAGNP